MALLNVSIRFKSDVPCDILSAQYLCDLQNGGWRFFYRWDLMKNLSGRYTLTRFLWRNS